MPHLWYIYTYIYVAHQSAKRVRVCVDVTKCVCIFDIGSFGLASCHQGVCRYGVATISRLITITGLYFKKSPMKETIF